MNLDTKRIIYCIFFGLVALSSLRCKAQEAEVIISFNENLNTRSSNADASITPLVGFLHSYPALDSLEIWNKMVKPLKPKFWRHREFNQALYDRMIKIDATMHYEVVLPGPLRINRDNQNDPQFPFNDPGRWRAYVVKKLNQIPQGLNVSIDVWNEPNRGHSWNNSSESFFEFFCQTVSLINTIRPDLEVVGPSTTGNQSREFVQALIDYMKEWKKRNVYLPLRLDYLALHSMGTYNNFRDDISYWSEYMFEKGNADLFETKALIYNEYLYEGKRTQNFSWAIKYLQLFETYGVKYASRACWGNCWDGSLDGLLVEENNNMKPSHIWYGYKRYATFTGKRYITSEIKDLGVIVGENDTSEKLILVGNLLENTRPITLKVEDLNQVEVFSITKNGEISKEFKSEKGSIQFSILPLESVIVILK